MDRELLDTTPIPAYLRGARDAYSQFIRHSLDAADCGDLPKNGPYLVGGLATGLSAGQLVVAMGLSESVSKRLIETLLANDYVVVGDGLPQWGTPEIILTPRGESAARAVREGVERVNAQLAERLGEDQFAGLVAGLEALNAIKESSEMGAHQRHADHHHDHDHDHPHAH